LLYIALKLSDNLPRFVGEHDFHTTSSTKYLQAPTDLGEEYSSEPFILS
jgi:hypothetical protein